MQTLHPRFPDWSALLSNTVLPEHFPDLRAHVAAAVAAYEKASKAFADPLANLKCDLAPDHLQKKAQEQANAQAQSQAQAPAEAPAGANATAADAANATATASASAEPKEQQDNAPAKAQI